MTLKPERIEKEMRELEKLLGYSFKNIKRLKEAMMSVRVKGAPGEGKNHREYTNEALATVGDAVLKAVLADCLFKKEHLKTKREITDRKRDLEKNEVLHKLVCGEGLVGFAYNNDHFKKDEKENSPNRVVCKQHDPYLEAIVGAVYYDCGFNKTKKWILNWLLPKLEKYK